MRLFCVENGTLAIHESPYLPENGLSVIAVSDGGLVLFCNLPHHILTRIQALYPGHKNVSLTTGSIFYEVKMNGYSEICKTGLTERIPCDAVVVGVAGEVDGVQYAICSPGISTAQAAVAAIMFVETGNIMARRIAQQREQLEVA